MIKRIIISRMLCITCILVALTVNSKSIAQSTAQGSLSEDSTTHSLIHKIGFDLRPGHVLPTNEFFKGNNTQQKRINKSFSVHLKYAFQFDKESRLGRLYPNTYQGIGVSYNTFFTPAELGNPITIYAFQSSRIAQLSPHLSLNYEWNFGASFGWKEYDEQTNPQNKVVGSDINAYLNLGLFLSWQLCPQWHLTAGIDCAHYSNGNTHYPNSGVNLVGGRIGIVHTFGERDATSATTSRQPLYSIKPHISYDLVVYGSTRKRGFMSNDVPNIVPGSFGVVGLNFNPMYNFSKYFKAGISMDAQYDESANIKNYKIENSSSNDLKFHRPPFREQFAVGISLRGELVMPIFSINVGIGRNLIYSGDDTKGFYQILAIKTSITRRLFVHVGYQLNKFKDPNNLMLGFGYRFHNKQ